jgi:hypothetical protein
MAVPAAVTANRKTDRLDGDVERRLGLDLEVQWCVARFTLKL